MPPPRSSGSLPAARSSGSLPAARPSGSLPAVRTSGQHQAVRPSGQPQAVGGPPPPPSEGHNGFAPPPPSSSNAMPPSSHSSGQLPAAHSNGPGAYEAQAQASLPPGKPTPAAVIAKYPRASREGLAGADVRDPRVHAAARAPQRPRVAPASALAGRAALRGARSVPTTRRRSGSGMAINCAALAVATFIFFLPVIFRFMRATEGRRLRRSSAT